MRKALGARRRRWWLVALLGGLLLLLVVPFSGLGRGARVRGVEHGAGAAPLRAGASVVRMSIPLPVPAVGYGLVRPEVSRVAFPISARAVVLASEKVKVGVVTLELLLADAGLVDEVRKSVAALGLSALWVAATHTHSSAGGFALNPVAQVAGTGRFRPEVRRAVVEAVSRALGQAAARLQAVEVFAGESELASGTGSRDEFPQVDRRLTRWSCAGRADRWRSWWCSRRTPRW